MVEIITNTAFDIIYFLTTYKSELVKSIIALFVVIDPLGNVPVFIALTQKLEKKDRKAISTSAILTASILLIIFGFAGTQILDLFGITIYSFMIAGGALLFIIAIELLTYGEWRFNKTSSTSDSGVVPIAFPLLAGPGAITTVIITYQTSGLAITIVSIIVVLLITYIILRLIHPIHRLLGNRGATVISRVFAIIIAAIAVQYIVEGFKNLI
ncbi:MAG: MarC family protein [Nitrososphaeraceae archaeon]